MAKTCRGCGREFSAGETFCPVDGSRLSSPSQARDLANSTDPLIGELLDGRYRVLRAIGEGGMGVVYEAEHVLIEKRVAVKVLRDAFTRRSDVVERFRQEAKSASRIGHPNIVDVYDFGETKAGASYIVLEMLKGEDLADILSRECALAPSRAAVIIFQVAKALDAAHKKQIVHRDLKPENIYLIEREGQPDFVKVVDFGVAKMGDIESIGGRKLTRTGMIFGTPEYMSPEHAGGKQLDHRVDIYALGVIFYELLTGRVPFEGDNFMEVLGKHGREPVPQLRDINPGTRVSPELEVVVQRALQKDPNARYQSMRELVNELRNVPEMPVMSHHESLTPPQWAMTVPPPPPRVDSSTAPTSIPAKRSLRALGFSSSGKLLTKHRNTIAVAAIVLSLFLLWISFGTESGEPTVAVGPASQPAAPSAPTPKLDAPAPMLAPVVSATPVVSAAPPSVQPPAAEATTVAVRIVTEPEGARVSADGLGEICPATPCIARLPRGVPLTLRAEHGQATETRSLAFNDATDLDMRFSALARKPVSVRSRMSAPAPQPAKVPELFR